MGGDDDSGSELIGGATEEGEDLVAARGVEVAGGLIGDEQGGLVDECAGDGNALHLSAGKLEGEGGSFFGEANPAEDLAGASFASRGAGEEKREFHVFESSEGREQLEGLKNEADGAAAKGGEFRVIEGGGRVACG